MMEYTSAIYPSWLENGQKICFLVDAFFVPRRHLTLPEGFCPLLISSYFFFVAPMSGVRSMVSHTTNPQWAFNESDYNTRNLYTYII